ncbi:uncharacterized protein LOC122498531 [Leptopilina heterotoma]|uniref:uncharacterized protein LOC122498531 n=1 Tax=Leptopilina heterotoma TaxID=63436 RepID=UPI001CA9E01F|nr:uncharacterized protein LOC122498531 [Leptopilina heterotoma]
MAQYSLLVSNIRYLIHYCICCVEIVNFERVLRTAPSRVTFWHMKTQTTKLTYFSFKIHRSRTGVVEAEFGLLTLPSWKKKKIEETEARKLIFSYIVTYRFC